jgi:hypothetical protein
VAESRSTSHPTSFAGKRSRLLPAGHFIWCCCVCVCSLRLPRPLTSQVTCVCLSQDQFLKVMQEGIVQPYGFSDRPEEDHDDDDDFFLEVNGSSDLRSKQRRSLSSLLTKSWLALNDRMISSAKRLKQPKVAYALYASTAESQNQIWPRGCSLMHKLVTCQIPM